MKISSTTSNYINQTYTNQANSANQENKPVKNQIEAANSSMSDSINLSGRTKDLQKVSQSMDSKSTERQELVSNLKEQVQANQYTVNAEKVAEKILGSMMDEIV